MSVKVSSDTLRCKCHGEMSTLIYGPVIPGAYNAAYYNFIPGVHVIDSDSMTVALSSIPRESDNVRKIYCLSLADDKYYIERTNYIDKRLSLHRERKACAWTALYEVIDVVEIVTAHVNEAPAVEREVVERYMKRYGVDNVRGGPFSSVNLTDRDYRRLCKKLA